MPIAKHRQTRTYIDIPPLLFEQIEAVARKYHLPRTTLLRRLVLHSFVNNLDTVLRTGEPATWDDPRDKDKPK